MKKLVVLLVLLLSFIFSPGTAFAQQSPSNKHIEVNLSTQKLQAFEGNTLIYEFPISSGTLKTPTVTGTYKPYAKILSQRMVGGNPSDGGYYNLPNVPNIVYFYQGYSLHGAYWHNNFGHPMSHGCVNVAPANMAVLYPWIDYNTDIHIFGQTPSY